MTQIVTGVVLAMQYVRNADVAFNDVEPIMRDVNFRWMFPCIHVYGVFGVLMSSPAIYNHIVRDLG